jgi:MarR family transcriptional regulator, organic hydroperoxide resistance regulator
MPKMTAAKPAPNTPSLSDDLQLSDYLCFAAYTVNLAFGRAYQPVLEKLGLTYTQYITIIALSEEGGQTVKGLGAKLFLESNTLTPMLKKLEAMGLLQRHRDPEDERQVRVTLTDKGRALRATRPEAAVTGDLMGLDREEFQQLQEAIVRLRTNLLRSRTSSAPLDPVSAG